MIKQFLAPGTNSQKVSIALLLLRITVGVLMLTHGVGKFSALFAGEPIQFGDPIGVGASGSLALTVFSEVLCSILLLFGIATRFAAIPLIITMFVAAFIVHIDDDFALQELSLFYGMIYIVLAIAGPGKFSVDAYLFNNVINRR